MFVIILRYIAPIEELDKYIVEHREFLDNNYIQGNFIVSGPQNLRTGGVIIGQASNREEMQEILSYDPFFRENLAEYQIFDFTPTKGDPAFSKYINKND